MKSFKIVVLLFVFASVFVLCATIAVAGESGFTKIAMTHASPGEFAVYTADYTPNPDPNNCGNPNYFMWDFAEWDSGKKVLYSSILAAYLSGKDVNIISGSCIYGGTVNKIDSVYIKN